MKNEMLRLMAEMLVVMLLMTVIAALLSCTRTFVPSGKPGCVAPQRWSDSAQTCVTREGR